MKLVGRFLLLMVLVGCGSETVDPKDPNGPSLDPLPVITAPPDPENSFLTLPAPHPLPTLHWNLAPGIPIEYDLKQEVILQDHARTGPSTRRTGDGTMRIVPTQDDKAAVTIVLNPLNKKLRSDFAYALFSNGAIYPTSTETAQKSAMHLDLLFTLPEQPLEIGKPKTRHFESTGAFSGLAHKGTIITSLTGFCKVRKWRCARLRSEIRIEMTPPENSPVKGSGQSRGVLISYFAYEDGLFVQMEMNDRTTVRAMAPLVREGMSSITMLNTDLDNELTVRVK